MSPTQPMARTPSAVRPAHRLRELLLADIDHDDGRARRAQMAGARETDAGSPAGDERDPAGQAVERGDVRGRHVVASPFRSDGARSLAEVSATAARAMRPGMEAMSVWV